MVCYRDHQYFTLLNQSNSINWAISNGVSNLKRIWIVPYYTQNNSATSSSTASRQISPVLQCTGSEPYYPSWNCQLTNIQLVLNGKNYYSNPITYGYEEFMHNVNPETLNGGQTDEIGAGLYDMYTWENCPLYVFDVSRNADIVSPDVSVSIQFIATNGTSNNIDLWAFCEYENRLVFDMSGNSLLVL